MRHFTRMLAAGATQTIAAVGRHVHVVAGPPRLNVEARQSTDVQFDVDLRPGQGFDAPWEFKEIRVTNPLTVAFPIEVVIGDGEFTEHDPPKLTVGGSTAMTGGVIGQWGVVKLRALERAVEIVEVSVLPLAGPPTEYRYGIEPDAVLNTVQQVNSPGWWSAPLVGSRATQLEAGAHVPPVAQWPRVPIATLLEPPNKPWVVDPGDVFLVQTVLANQSINVSFVWQEVM